MTIGIPDLLTIAGGAIAFMLWTLSQQSARIRDAEKIIADLDTKYASKSAVETGFDRLYTRLERISEDIQSGREKEMEALRRALETRQEPGADAAELRRELTALRARLGDLS